MESEKIKRLAVILVLATQIFVLAASAQTRPAVELEGAIAEEQVDGDLKTAMTAYQRIAAESSAPRDVRARALLHLARCYEKLGQQAQTVYQQIVRDFADQPEAAQARARLAALKQGDRANAPSTMTLRKIEQPSPSAGGSMGPGNTDGHRAVYLNAAAEVIYGDLSGNSKRVVFKAKLDDLPLLFASRDFSVVGLVLHAYKPGRQQTIAIVNTDGTGYRELAQLDFPNYHPDDFQLTWSWDNRYILCVQPQGSTSRLLRISVPGGRIRELLTLKAGTMRAAVFSPDGRFVAYQDDAVTRIFVLPVEGGEPQLVYEEGQPTQVFNTFSSVHLLDWTADGRYLLIASERTGKGGLHLLPITDGKSAGAPIFLKFGDFEYGITTASGGLVFRSVKPGGLWALYVASLDEDSRPGDWKRLDLPIGNTDNPWPKWSGDSKHIVYVAKDVDAGKSAGEVHLHNPSTGEDRDLYHALGSISCVWAVQEPKLFCIEATAKAEIFSIAIDSGEIDRLHTFTALPRRMIICPSRDDRALYMYKIGVDYAGQLVRWEIATGQETILERYYPLESWESMSPDERWIIRWAKQNLEVRAFSFGDWKTLVSLRGIPALGHANDTPDGNWLLYHDVDAAGRQSLFRVATAGGTPERRGDLPTSSPYGTLEISPNGSRIIVSGGDYLSGYELWSLENFIPSAPKR